MLRRSATASDRIVLVWAGTGVVVPDVLNSMTRLRMALTVAAPLVSCSSTDTSSSTTNEPSVQSTSANPRLDPTDPRPVLTLGFWAYGPVEYWRSQDLADIYLYPDGRVIRVTLDGVSDTRALQFHALTIDQTDLERLMSLADAAGLTGGGLQPMVSLPENVQVEDGGAAMFTSRDGNVVTARAVDQLSTDGAFAVGVRIAFSNLLAALAPWCCQPRDDLTVEPFTRWAIVSSGGASLVPYPEQEWTGPDSSTLAWVDVGRDVRCAVIDRADWPLTLSERRVPHLIFDGRLVTRRPLLPHELGCDDVAAFRRLLGLDTT